MNENESKNPIDAFLERPDLRSDDDPLPVWADWRERVVCGGKRSVRLLREDPDEWADYAAMWRESFPEITGSLLEFAMDSGTYPEVFGAGDEWMKRIHLAVTLMDLEEDRLFGGAAFLLEPEERSAQAILMAVLPDYRNKVTTARTLYALYEGYDDLLTRTGVDYAWCLATARHRLTQQLFHRIGWTVRGVMPGMQRSYVGLGMHRRDAVVHMDKLYNRGPEIAERGTGKMELIPAAKKLWDAMEGEGAE